MHGCLQCLKILYIHNCWNLFFVPKPFWNSDYQKLSNFKIDFFYHSVISPFAVKLFLLRLVLIAQRKISVLVTLVTSSNLHNQAPQFTELRILQGTLIIFIEHTISHLFSW